MRGYRGFTLLLYVTVTQAGKHYLRQSRVHFLSDRADQNIQLEHHHYVIDTSLDEYKAGGGVIIDDYNEIDDSLTKVKNDRETRYLEKEDEKGIISVLVPVREVVSILPVDYAESPLNISFKPLGGDFILEDNLTVSIIDQDITEAVIDQVKIILSKTENDHTVTVDGVLDELLADNLIVKAKIKENTKDPVDIYLELLGDVVKFDDRTNGTNLVKEDSSKDPLKYVTEETTTELGIIDYSDDYNYPDFYDDESSIPEHINQDDLLVGDSFENKGNIDLMSNDKSDFILEQTSTEQAPEENESFNAAFPELYKDLAIFNSLPKKGRRSDIRVKKRAEIFSDVVEIDTKSKKINTPTTTSLPKQHKTVKLSSSINKANLHNFLKPSDADIDKELVIKTSAGSLLGHMKLSAKGKNITEFVGIPYAKPPTENLRFKPPQASEPWTGIMNNSQRRPQCWSSHFSNSWDVEDTGMSENCLYLSVWSSDIKRENLTSVMVILSSGEEDTSESDGIELADVGDVVVVMVESRHGALGFLAAEDMVSANIGLLDQTLALKWIQDNIDLFGGDAERVTILGNGLGGSIASLHLISQKSCSLFNNVIIQSGSAFDKVINMQEAVRRTKVLAQLVGCDYKFDHAKMVDCLRKIDPQVLINQEQSVSNYSLNMEPFPPVIDSQFIIEDPKTMLENKVFKKCPMMIGTNANEGLSDMIEYIPELGLQENLFELDENQLDSGMARMFKDLSSPILNLVKFQYGILNEGDGSKAAKVKRFFGLQSALADKQVICHVDKMAKIFADDANQVFKYMFNPLDDNIFASEKAYILGKPLKSLGKSQGGLQKNLSEKMIKMWSAFSKTNNPNSDLDEEEEIWPQFQDPKWKYLKLEDEKYEQGNDIRGRVCQFWEKVIPEFLPPKNDRLMRRTGGKQELSCSTLKNSKMYFPGYRTISRL